MFRKDFTKKNNFTLELALRKCTDFAGEEEHCLSQLRLLQENAIAWVSNK